MVKRLVIEDFEKDEFKKYVGKEIICVECVTNDDEEISKDIYICDTLEEANEYCEHMNEINVDKRLKFIVITYEIEVDKDGHYYGLIS